MADSVEIATEVKMEVKEEHVKEVPMKEGKEAKAVGEVREGKDRGDGKEGKDRGDGKDVVEIKTGKEDKEKYKKTREFYRAASSSKSANSQAVVKQQGKNSGSSPSRGRSQSATVVGKDKQVGVGSRSGTPRMEGSRGSTPKNSRSNTPKVLPKLQYSRDDLMKYRLSPLVKEKPAVVNSVTTDVDIIREAPIGLENIRTKKWESEFWLRNPSHFDSRGNSPMTVGGGPRRKNLGGSDADNTRNKEEGLEDDQGIVLGPQRKSFGYGCSVTQSSRGGGRGQRDDRDMDRRGRIGSGRISIGRDDRPYREAGDRDRDRDRDLRGPDRNYDRGYYRNQPDRRRGSEYEGSYRRYDRHQSYEEDVPEWFTDAPVSRDDTIELKGFADDPHEKHRRKSSNTDGGPRKRGKPSTDDKGKSPSPKAQATANFKESEQKKNEAKKENQQPSPAKAKPKEPSLNTSEMPPGFDFNPLFDGSGLPSIFSGLMGNEVNRSSPSFNTGLTSSRFQQFFQPQSTTPPSQPRSITPKSQESAQSSINEEFGYLNDLVNGSKSPAAPSPPGVAEPQQPPIQRPLPGMLEQQAAASAMPPIRRFPAEQQKAEALRASDFEASLKAMLNNAASKQHLERPPEGNDPKDVAATGKTLAEAEAKMAAGKQPEPGQSTADMTAFQSFLTKIHQLEQQNQNQHSAAYSNALQQSAFIKNLLMKNAAINNRISSPITMGGLSPSGTSPMQHGSRTSSPIIFGSQPPRHLAAPAPIHPGAMAPPLSPRGLAPQLGMMNPGMVGQGLRSPVPLRQPSPQDLRAHAQAILQNAVLKKQFQEQRAEQLKKQLEWAAAISKAEVNQMNSFHNSMNQQPVQATSLSVQDNATSTPTAAKVKHFNLFL